MRAASLCLVVVTAANAAWACPWDYETFAAESAALPCLGAIAVGVYPSHGPDYWKRRLELADWQLAFAPNALGALDAKVVSLLALKRADDAVTVARARLALAPDAYESHANLSTALTFAGQLDEALAEVDRALASNPQAHFGREKVHRQLLAYLVRLRAEPALVEREDFLGQALGVASKRPAEETALELDALVSMIAVYGASEVPHLWAALGDTALTRGQPRVAWAAFARARTLKHPAAAALARAQQTIEADLKAAWKPSPDIAGMIADGILRPDSEEGGWAGMQRSVEHERSRYQARWDAYLKSEKQLLAAGLTFWNAAGAAALYARQVSLGLRCAAPVFPEKPAAPPAADGVFARLGDQVRLRSCGSAAEVLGKALVTEKEALAQRAAGAPLEADAELDGLSELFARCGSKLAAVKAKAAAVTARPAK